MIYPTTIPAISRRFAWLAALVALASPATSGATADCSGVSAGFVPLDDLGQAAYLGHQGGLYPQGARQMPPAHFAAGVFESQRIHPRDAQGNIDPAGTVVILTIGMSNCWAESEFFADSVAADPLRRPGIEVVNGALIGSTAEEMSRPWDIAWSNVDVQLAAAGKTAPQVQVVWYKQTNTHSSQGFPEFADSLSAQSGRVMNILRAKFPNARALYVTGRTYAGYAIGTLNPEPYAYETGFGMKWLIERQIAGDPSLAFDSLQGVPVAPWIAWGPYLWADGLTPRSDGLTWACDEFSRDDGTHLSPLGRAKVAGLLVRFLRTDPIAASWYLPPASSGVAGGGEAVPGGAFAVAPPRAGAAGEGREFTVSVPAACRLAASVTDARGRRVRRLAEREFAPGEHLLSWNGRDEAGRPVAPGVYFAVVESAGRARAARKFVLSR